VIVERLARPIVGSSPQQVSPTGLSATAGLRQAWEVFWRHLRAHMADVHGLPRDGAAERPPRAHS
jgi:hypothetical protein